VDQLARAARDGRSDVGARLREQMSRAKDGRKKKKAEDE
jgi:hypothetical protein